MNSHPNLDRRAKVLLGMAIAVSVLSSCSINYSYSTQIAADNRGKLNRLSTGMDKNEVLTVMGTQMIRSIEGAIINSPYRVETLKDINGDKLEVMFFYTDEKKDANVVSDDELTPVILSEGKVQGWGRTYLADLVPAYRYRSH